MFIQYLGYLYTTLSLWKSNESYTELHPEGNGMFAFFIAELYNSKEVKVTWRMKNEQCVEMKIVMQ